jgi:two-component system sensor histidine kinase YesM
VNNKRFFSIRSKIMIFSLILTVFPLLVVGTISYVASTNLVQSQVSNLNLVNAQQISNNIEFMMNDVKTISLNLIQNRTITGYLASSNPDYKRGQHLQVLSMLDDQIFNKKYIYSIYIQDWHGSGLDNRGAVNTVYDTRLDQARQLYGKETWYFDTLTVMNKKVNVISMVREIRDVNNISKTLGIVKINVLESSIRELYSAKIKDKSLFYIIDQDNNILSTQSREEAGSTLGSNILLTEMGRQSQGYFDTKIDGNNYLAIFYTMESSNWKIIDLTPYELISKSGDVIKSATFFSIIVTLIISLFFIFFFVARVLKPLKQIRILMKQVEHEKFDNEMKVQGNDEITLVALSFNRMSHKLDELVNEVHVSHIKQKEAELKALEEQINPHFLYNTLDLIYWMSRMEKAFETSVMINALSQLFRLGLNSGSGFTTVGKEVDHLRNYILIQQKRYEETIAFSIDAAADTLDCKVTKIILQPIVENAISHGIEQKGGYGRIDIRIYSEDDCLIYTVSDDGAGADETTIRGLLEHVGDDNKGLGLKNINDRIKLNYGSQYGIEFHSVPSEGTTVTVRQPLIKGTGSDV